MLCAVVAITSESELNGFCVVWFVLQTSLYLLKCSHLICFVATLLQRFLKLRLQNNKKHRKRFLLENLLIFHIWIIIIPFIRRITR